MGVCVEDNTFGQVVRAKARLVARGLSQRGGIGYLETFSPWPCVPSVRSLTAIACELGLDLCNFGAEQAFVQSKLDEDAYLGMPQGCGALSGKVMKLGRSFYGLKQASRTWHNHLVRGMRSLGFEQCAADACVMRLVEDGVVSMVIVVHVDDIFSTGRKSRCDHFGRDLNQYVSIPNLGELRLYDGCQFSRDFDSGTITIPPQTVAENMVEEFGVTRTKETPMVIGLRLDDFDPTEHDVDERFQSLVGHLMWLANQSRPDILNAMRAVARYFHAPKLVHWKAALHVLTYVGFTSSYGITFQQGTASGVGWEVCVDSDFASRATGRMSVSSGVVMCAGACVSFFSRTQKSMTLSSTAA